MRHSFSTINRVRSSTAEQPAFTRQVVGARPTGRIFFRRSAGPLAQSSKAPGRQPEGHGAKPVRTPFASGTRKKAIRLAWDQETPGALPGCPTIFGGDQSGSAAIVFSEGWQVLTDRLLSGISLERYQVREPFPIFFPFPRSSGDQSAALRRRRPQVQVLPRVPSFSFLVKTLRERARAPLDWVSCAAFWL